jgi:hypothetical protein
VVAGGSMWFIILLFIVIVAGCAQLNCIIESRRMRARENNRSEIEP